MVDKLDMSLDDIIKLNKKKIKEEKKAPATSDANQSQTGRNTQQSGAKNRSRSTRKGQSAATGSKSKNTKYAGPNKLRKFPTQNTRVTGARGNAQQKRKLTTKRSQQSVNRARQTLSQSLQKKRKTAKDRLLNNYRGINNQPKSANTSKTNAETRRQLVRSRLGVMHADVEDQAIKQRQANAFKYAAEAAVTGQRKQNIKRRWASFDKYRRSNRKLKRQQERAKASAAGVVSKETILRQQRKLKKQQREQVAPCDSLIVSVKNEYVTTNTASTSRADAANNQTVANRMLKHNLQQPMRERRQMQRQNKRRERGSGVRGQVKMLNDSIQKLQQQVAYLQGDGQNRSQQGRRRRRSGPRQGGYNTNRNYSNSRHNNSRSRQDSRSTRRVMW